MKSIKIVIIDDEMEEALVLKEKVKKYLSSDEIYVLSNFDKSFIENHKIDVLFLDIELGHYVNGIEEIKKLQKNKQIDMSVVFVTHYDDLIFDALTVFPIYFVRKREMDRDLKNACKALKKEYCAIQDTILFAEKNITVDKIMYLESKNNDVYIHLQDGTILKERKKLDDIEKQIAKFDFIRCHQSYLVNVLYIHRCIKGHVILYDSTTIAISRKYKKSFKNQFMEYQLEHVE